MESRPKSYTYHTAVKWTEQRKGVISCVGKPDVQVATPPEFKGHEDIWSPEDLFVASANICLMTTFLAVAERAGLTFTSYESVAEGTAGIGRWEVSVHHHHIEADDHALRERRCGQSQGADRES